TLVAMGTAVLVFRRTTRTLTRGRDALDEAAIAAALLALMVMLVVPFSRTDSSGIALLLDLVAPRDADEVKGHASVIAWQAPLGTLVVSLVTLSATTLTRGDWWGERGARLHRLLHAPLCGLAALMLALPVAGAIGVLLLAGGDPAPAGRVEATSGVGLGMAALATWGFAVVAMGAYGPVGHTVSGT